MATYANVCFGVDTSASLQGCLSAALRIADVSQTGHVPASVRQQCKVPVTGAPATFGRCLHRGHSTLAAPFKAALSAPFLTALLCGSVLHTAGHCASSRRAHGPGRRERRPGVCLLGSGSWGTEPLRAAASAAQHQATPYSGPGSGQGA